MLQLQLWLVGDQGTHNNTHMLGGQSLSSISSSAITRACLRALRATRTRFLSSGIDVYKYRRDDKVCCDSAAVF